MPVPVLTGSKLNEIPLFNADSLSSLCAVLPDIAKIYTSHQVQKSWAIGYLHLHDQIRDTCVLLHEWDGLKQLCTPHEIDDLDLKSLNGRAFCLNDGEFAAYEAASRQIDRSPLKPEFLIELKQFLIERSLQHVFSIVPRQEAVFIETVLENGGTLSTIWQPQIHQCLETFSTEWRVAIEDGSVQLITQKECQRQVNGEHLTDTPKK